MTSPSADYRLIPLTKGQFAKVSPHRFEELSSFAWYAYWNEHTRSFYARRTDYPNGWRQTSITVQMHRQILGLEKGDGTKGDHFNHDTLDNTDGNLRKANGHQNAQNERRPKNNTSGYKGVFLEKPYMKRQARYIAAIQIGGRPRKIGRFPVTPEGLLAAAHAYDEAAVRNFGEFAHVNFPNSCSPSC